MERNVLVGGQVLETHFKEDCYGTYCTVHNHSAHHMRKWNQNYRWDAGYMERICPHGIGHPDPDEVSIHDKTHSCDGCCNPENAFNDDVQELEKDYKEETPAPTFFSTSTTTTTGPSGATYVVTTGGPLGTHIHYTSNTSSYTTNRHRGIDYK